jgi:hypothetical protein
MIPNVRCIFRSAVLAGALAGLLLACGGESEPAAGGAPAAAPAAPAPAASPPTAHPMAPEDMYEWNPAAGAPRDLAADSATCQAEITGQGLAGVAQHLQCMRRLGWNTRPPAS